MPDGIELLTDHYRPRDVEKPPVVLIRSPYGKGGFFASSMAKPFALRGFQVILQCCRGTGGSAGVFNPHHDERADGLATLEWIKAQEWYGGSIVTYGPSYLGYTQWAVARDAGPELKAMAMQVTLANFARMTYAGNSLMLENALSWTHMMTGMKRRLFALRLMLSMVLGMDMIGKARWRILPLDTMDVEAVGERVPFWQDWMQHASDDDPWWRPMDFARTIADVARPISMVAGWSDIFVPWQLEDFTALQNAGRPVRLTVGPWRHTDPALGQEGITDAIGWYRAHVLGDTSALHPKPVRLYVVGAEEWRYFDAWPPRESTPTRLFLRPAFGLSDESAPESPADEYRYDPNDPTPSIGGAALMSKPFSVDNGDLEARADVLTYTGTVLVGDMDLVGCVEANLYVTSDAPSADFFVRLCDVDARGVSRNVCDGLRRIRLSTPGEVTALRVQLWPTAFRFKAGHRIRVQISSGAFPRWARNPGGDEPLGRARECRVARQSIHHDPRHPSSITLPVLRAAP